MIADEYGSAVPHRPPLLLPCGCQFAGRDGQWTTICVEHADARTKLYRLVTESLKQAVLEEQREKAA